MKKIIIIFTILTLITAGSITSINFMVKNELSDTAEKLFQDVKNSKYEEIYKDTTKIFKDSYEYKVILVKSDDLKNYKTSVWEEKRIDNISKGYLKGYIVLNSGKKLKCEILFYKKDKKWKVDFFQIKIK